MNNHAMLIARAAAELASARTEFASLAHTASASRFERAQERLNAAEVRWHSLNGDRN